MLKIDLNQFAKDTMGEEEFFKAYQWDVGGVPVRVLLESLLSEETKERECLLWLYRSGVTCEELGKVEGRAFQSIYRTMRTFGEKDIKNTNRENRKKWVVLVKYYYLVYEAEKLGGFPYIERTYRLSKRKAREVYKELGGEKLIQQEEEDRNQKIFEVKFYYKEGYTGGEISKKLGIPISTVYYYLKL